MKKQKLYDAIGYQGEDISTSNYPEEVCYSILLRFISILSLVC